MFGNEVIMNEVTDITLPIGTVAETYDDMPWDCTYISQLGHLQSLAISQLGHLQSPAVSQLGHLQSPAVSQLGHLQSLALSQLGHLQSLPTLSRSHVLAAGKYIQVTP
jgi:hypothetical protein